MLIETCTYIKANIGFSSYQKVLPAIIRRNKICNTVDKRHDISYLLRFAFIKSKLLFLAESKNIC